MTVSFLEMIQKIVEVHLLPNLKENPYFAVSIIVASAQRWNPSAAAIEIDILQTILPMLMPAVAR